MHITHCILRRFFKLFAKITLNLPDARDRIPSLMPKTGFKSNFKSLLKLDICSEEMLVTGGGGGSGGGGRRSTLVEGNRCRLPFIKEPPRRSAYGTGCQQVLHSPMDLQMRCILYRIPMT